MRGPAIVAALFGSALLLHLAFKAAVGSVIGPPVQEAVGNVEALKRIHQASSAADSAAKERRRAKLRRPTGEVRDAPAGWAPESDWGQPPASSTSRKAGP